MTRIELLSKPNTTVITEDISTTVEYQNFVVTDLNGTINPNLIPLNFNTGDTIVSRITEVNNGKYILNGDFASINGITTPDIAIFTGGTTFAPSSIKITTTSTEYVTSTQEDANFYYVAGYITTVGSNTNIKNIYKVSKTGTPNVIDSTFATNIGTGPNNQISAMKLYNTSYGAKLIVCGNFTTWNGVNTGCMVILNLDGTIWSGFNNTYKVLGYINNIKEFGNSLVIFGSIYQIDTYTINNYFQLSDTLNPSFNNSPTNYGEIVDVVFDYHSVTNEFQQFFATSSGLWDISAGGINLTPGIQCNSIAGATLDATNYSLVASFGTSIKRYKINNNVATVDPSFKINSVDGFVTAISYDSTNNQYLFGGQYSLVTFITVTPPQTNQNKLAYGYLDIDDNTAFPINMGVADIRDISKKTGTFSKTITLLGTANNNLLLNQLYDLNIEGTDFDVNKITYCNIIQNGVTIISDAIFQLVSVNKEQETNQVEEKLSYSALIKDSASDFFNIINQKKLEDLKCFDYLNHNLTSEKVIESFSHTEVDGYKYVMPMGTTTGATAGTYLTGDTVYNIEEFVPGIYAKKYFDSIIGQAGFTYQWDSLTDKDIQFDKLLIPYNGDIQKSEKSESVEYNVSVTSTIPNTISNGVGYGIRTLYGRFNNPIQNKDFYGMRNDVDYNVENYDYSNLFDLATNMYTTPNIPSNTNRIVFEYEYDYELFVNNMDTVPAHLVYGGREQTNNGSDESKGNKVLYIVPFAELWQNAGPLVAFNQTNQDAVFNYGYVFTNSNHPVYPVGITPLKSGTTKGIIPENIVTPGKQYKIINGMSLVPNNVMGDVPALIDRYFFRNFWNLNNNQSRQVNAEIQLRVTEVRMVVKFQIEGNLGYNYPVQMNKFVPKNIKQADFIKSIFTMYNLFCESDKQNPNKLIIQGRDGYYDDGIVLDWTDKLIKDEAQEIKFLNDVSKKKQILTYKQDTDIPNVTYFNKFNEIYGQVEYTYASEFVKDIDKKELIFSPTPISNMINGAIVPMLLGPAPKTNIRILYDGGPYTCGNYSIINYQGNTVVNNTFPYLSHFDKPFNPTFDINFATCDDYFDKTIQSITNNNLFNLHWRRTIKQIDTGKMLSASFMLREDDIKDIKLNSKIKVGNSWFQINKIIDYDANTTKPTKVELITADEGIKIPFISKPLPVSINNNSKFEVESGMMKRRTYQTNLIDSPGDFQINGMNNVIDSGFKSGIIDGNYNRIDSNALVFGDGNLVQDTNFVMGSNNTIIPGVGNSIVIGNGTTAVTSNTLYANNIVIPTGGTLNGVAIESGTTISLSDTYVTGGTYSSGTAIFTNNTGGTFSVTGFPTSGGTTSLWFATNSTNPIVNPVATGTDSIAIGDNAQALAPNVLSFGTSAGNGSTNASNSNFIGNSAGYGATNAFNSNFFGFEAGNVATNATSSNFIGNQAGYFATGASYSTLIGYNVGRSFPGNQIGKNNIIIGTNISLPLGTTNSINLGGILFGTGAYSATTGDPSITANAIGKIGVGVVTPTANLDIAPSTTAAALMRLRVGSAPTTPNDGDVWLESNTNTGLKIRINGVTKTISLI